MAPNSQIAPARHESVLALLRAYPGETDPEKLIRRRAVEKIVSAKSRGWSGPPFCPLQLASLFGIRCEKVHHDIGGDGRLLALPDGKLRIEYHSGKLPERQRFTIFHEFAHTLFPDYCDFLPSHSTPEKKLPDPEIEFENLCDIAASEMLFPEAEFHRDLAAFDKISMAGICSLSSSYVASIDAAIHRFIFHSSRVSNVAVPCCAVFLTDQQGNYKGTGPLWVKYIKRNSLFRGFIWPGTTPPGESETIQCFRGNRDITPVKKETWWMDGKPHTWQVQAARLPTIANSPDYPKVVALFLPSNYGSS